MSTQIILPFRIVPPCTVLAGNYLNVFPRYSQNLLQFGLLALLIDNNNPFGALLMVTNICILQKRILGNLQAYSLLQLLFRSFRASLV